MWGQVNDGTPTYYTYNAASQMLTETTGAATTYYHYDGCGNTTAKQAPAGTTYYQYDTENLMTRIDFPDDTHNYYTYDADSKRVSQRTAEGYSEFIYQGPDMLKLQMERDEDGDTKVQYTMGNGLEAMRRDAGGGITSGDSSFYHYNHLGTTVALVQDAERDLAGLAIIDGTKYREVTLTLQQGAWVAGSVQDRDGNPLPGVEMTVRVRTGDDWQGPFMPTDISGKTGADGKVPLGPLPPGAPLTFRLPHELERLTVSNPPEAGNPVVLEPGETRTIEPYVIALEGHSVRGMVVDAEGNPVKGALVIAGWSRNVQTRTDNEGRFELESLSPNADRTILAALPDGSAACAQPIDASVALEPTLQLVAPVTIVATALDADGQPVAGVTGAVDSNIVGSGLPAPLRTRVGDLQTDENGQFTVENLVAGLAYFVHAYTGDRAAPEHVWSAQVLPVGGEGVIEIALTRNR